MNFSIITLFPSMFSALNEGVIGRALNKSLIQLTCFNPRDYTTDNYQTVDDKPYGGGAGMVMKAEPLYKAIHAAKTQHPDSRVIHLSPQGKQFSHEIAKSAATETGLIFISGRYEGIDQRLLDMTVDEEWSLGDYVISGGELAAMVMIDAITRLIPGTLGDHASALEDSLSDGLLKYPQYTRPDDFMGQQVPEVLLGGDHKAIAKWREMMALGTTWLKRPDLLEKIPLSDTQKALLNTFIARYNSRLSDRSEP